MMVLTMIMKKCPPRDFERNGTPDIVVYDVWTRLNCARRELRKCAYTINPEFVGFQNLMSLKLCLNQQLTPMLRVSLIFLYAYFEGIRAAKTWFQ